jgi:chlorite dismutase
MYNWFECKIKYDKMLETGMQKTVTEPYLVDALSFTEAEARIIEEIKPFISGEFSVSDIKRVKYTESFFNETGDRYYKARLYFISLDEKSGAEKKTAVNMLVQASELKEAVEIVETEMKKTMIDYAIASVAETAIMDVFPYSGEHAVDTVKEQE